MKLLERFSKYPQTRSDKPFIDEVLLDRETDLLNITAKFHNFGKLLQILFKCTDNLWNSCLFTRRGAKNTLLSVGSKQLHTPSIGWQKGSHIGKCWFQLPKWQSVIQNLLLYCLKIFTLKSLPLTTWRFPFITSYRMHSELKNYSVHKNFLFLLSVWSQCNSEIIQSSLQFVADWHLFTNQFVIVQFA